MTAEPKSRDLAWEGILAAFASDRTVTVRAVMDGKDLSARRRGTVQNTFSVMRTLGLVEMSSHGHYRLTDAGVELIRDVVDVHVAVWRAGR